MNKPISLVLLVGLLSGCQSTQSSSTQDTVAEAPQAQIVEMAGHYEKAGEYEKALVYFLKAMESEPDNIQLLYKIAQLQKIMGKPQYALHMLDQVLEKQPEHVAALTEAALLLLENKQIERAIQYLTRVKLIDQQRLQQGAAANGSLVSLDTESPIEAYNGLGVALDLAGRYADAQQLYDLCLALDNLSPVVLTNMGYSHYLNGSYATAIDYFHRAIDVSPDHQRSWYNLGLVYSRMGRYNKAFQTLRRVMNEEQAYNDLGYFLMLEKRYEEAEYFFEKAINASPRYYEVAYKNLNNVREQLSAQQQDDTLPW